MAAGHLSSRELFRNGREVVSSSSRMLAAGGKQIAFDTETAVVSCSRPHRG